MSDKEQDAGQERLPEQDSGLVDVFDDEETRRFRVTDLQTDAPGDQTEDDEQLEERDYRPIRFRRDSRTGILGGLMYFTFVICLSVIIACAGWMAACDVLALNKDPVTAAVTLPKDIFSPKEVDVKDREGKVTGQRTVNAADIDYVADALKDAGIIEYKALFKLFAKISHADVKLDPGTYVLNTELDYRAGEKHAGGHGEHGGDDPHLPGGHDHGADLRQAGGRGRVQRAGSL